MNERIGQLEGHPVELNCQPSPNRPCYLCGTQSWKWSGYGWRCLTCQAEPTAIDELRASLERLSEENRQLGERIAELEPMVLAQDERVVQA